MANVATLQFFVVGVQRCGTTWLRRALGAHPQIEMAEPERPEPKFFLQRDPGSAGVGAYLSAHFTGREVRARGEKGTSYLDHPRSWTAILRAFPEARFIVILRDPVARAISHWRFSTAHGIEHQPAERALTDPALQSRPFDRSRFSTSPFAYLSRGHYARALGRLFDAVGRDRVAVVFLEELRDGHESLVALWRFLGVDPTLAGAVPDTPVNAAPSRPVADELVQHLAVHYARPNRELADLLGRPLPAGWMQ